MEKRVEIKNVTDQDKRDIGELCYILSSINKEDKDVLMAIAHAFKAREVIGKLQVN